MKKILLLLLITFVSIQAQEQPLSLWKLGSGIIEPANNWTVKFATPFTLGGVSVTTTPQQLNLLNGATGTTGTTTTNLVFSTSPVLVTPTLGVATGTSLALGGATIGTNALAVTGTSLFSNTVNMSLLVEGTNAATIGRMTFGKIVGGYGQFGEGFDISGNSFTYRYSDYAVKINTASGIWGFDTAPIGVAGDTIPFSRKMTIANTGEVTFANAILAAAGSAATPSISFSGDVNTGLYSVGADKLGVAVNGTNMVTVTTTGVGIGTTSPGAKLHVYEGDGGLSSFTGDSFVIEGSSSAYINLDTSISGYGGLWFSDDVNQIGGIYYKHGTDERLALRETGADRLTIKAGNVGIGTPSPFHKQSTVVSTSTNLNAFNFVNSTINLSRATVAGSIDTASVNLKYSTLGSPTLSIVGKTGNVLFRQDSVTTSLGSNLTLLDPGTNANSYSISLVADNSTTTQTGAIQVMYGADPYLRFSAPNDAGTATAIMDLKDQRVVIGAGTDAVDYDIFMNGFSNQGTITYMEDEDRFDFDNDVKIGASLWGSAVMSGTDAFTTTATADTVAVTGATVNDIYILTFITAVTAAESPLSVVATATGFIATRPAGATSDASYAWMRQRK